MDWTYIPSAGNACCPHCKSEFDLNSARPTFGERLPHNDIFVYIMCPVCHADFDVGDPLTRKHMSNACFVNVKEHGFSKPGEFHPYAVTTELTIALNDGSLVDAVWKGHDLSPSEYFSICAQNPQWVAVLGGITLIVSGGDGEAE